MLEEHRKTTSEAVERIRQGEKLCTEAVEAVSTMWELLLDDEAIEKIKEDARETNLKITAVKVDMKKLSLKEKAGKIAELKQLSRK